jgi:hypothetical protein
MMRPFVGNLLKGYDAAQRISTRITRGFGKAGMCAMEDTSTKVV